MKKIELSTEKAKELFGKDKVMDELLLANFTKEELTEPKLPESWEEYCEMNTTAENAIGFAYKITTEILLSDKFLSKQYAERKLYLLMKEYNGEWVADWGNDGKRKYVIQRYGKRISAVYYYGDYHFLAFPTEKLRDKFLNNFKDLIEIYFEL